MGKEGEEAHNIEGDDLMMDFKLNPGDEVGDWVTG